MLQISNYRWRASPRRNLAELIDRLSRIKGVQDISLTTNGYLLKDQAKDLKDAGLNRITISLDTIDPLLFQTMSDEISDFKGARWY